MDRNGKLPIMQSAIDRADQGTGGLAARFSRIMKHLSAATALVLTLAACSSRPSTSAGEPAATSVPTAAETGMAVEDNEAVLARAEPMVMPVGAPPVLEADGLGDLRIGKAVPEDSGWGGQGPQASGGCHIVTSPDYPGVYAIVEQGKVQRITVAENSRITLPDGIGIGTREAAVKAAFPGFRAEPHAYDSDPAKYLTAPDAKNGRPALRFEIGQHGRVSAIHAGTMPELGYVEGCA
ncbi:MAG: hypothetical protein P8Y58_00280 [Novosphingobium sp.]